MDWKHLLVYITGTVDQELLLRNEYLVTENRVLYLQATDNSSGSQSGKIVSFHYRERGRCHDTEPVVLPAPIGHSRIHLPRHPCLVARPSQGYI